TAIAQNGGREHPDVLLVAAGQREPGTRLGNASLQLLQIEVPPVVRDAGEHRVIARPGDADEEGIFVPAAAVEEIFAQAGQAAAFVPGPVLREFGAQDLCFLLLDGGGEDAVGEQEEGEAAEDKKRGVPQVQPETETASRTFNRP